MLGKVDLENLTKVYTNFIAMGWSVEEAVSFIDMAKKHIDKHFSHPYIFEESDCYHRNKNRRVMKDMHGESETICNDCGKVWQ